MVIIASHLRRDAWAEKDTLGARFNYNLSGLVTYMYRRYIIATIFPDLHLRVLPFNRCITSLDDLASSEFKRRVSKNFHVNSIRAGSDPSPTQAHEIAMFLDGRWYSLLPRDSVLFSIQHDPVDSLDPEILLNRLLRPFLGVRCPRTDKRLQYVCGDAGFQELERRVYSGEAQVSFCLRSVTVEQIMGVADLNRLLPPKVKKLHPVCVNKIICSRPLVSILSL